MTEKKKIRKVTKFSPNKDGFAFVNRFSGLPFTGALDKFIDRENTVHGLCGGMCYTALDHYYKGKPLPEDREVPGKETKLYGYLAERQSESWGVMWTRVVDYARRMFWDEDKALEQNRKAWMDIKKRLDEDDPVVLGLVYNSISESLKLTDNHQVIGYGYTEEVDGDILIDLYDPNYGRANDVLLQLRPEGSGFQVSEKHGKKEKPVYTFFHVPYTPKTPQD